MFCTFEVLYLPGFTDKNRTEALELGREIIFFCFKVSIAHYEVLPIQYTDFFQKKKLKI